MKTNKQKFYPTKWEAAANAKCQPLEKILFFCNGFAYSET